eukprot:11214024-Lingulodinium_polyedra.AAC.1
MARGCAFADSVELKWLGEVKSKSFEQLAYNVSDRFRKAGMILGAALEQVLSKSQEQSSTMLTPSARSSGRGAR